MAYRNQQLLWLVLLLVASLSGLVTCDQAADDDQGDDAQQNDDQVNNDDGNGANGDDGANYYNNANYNYNNGDGGDDNDGGNYYNDNNAAAEDYSSAGDYIQYWTNYAIYPKRCIVYNNVDVIVYSIYEDVYNHCVDDAVGTYITPVPRFIQGYIKQQSQNAYDQGYDFEQPEVLQYAYCTEFVIQNQAYYFQLGCSDDSTQKLAVNIYSDKTCTTRSVVDGFDDSNIDVSAINLNMKKCEACVNWFDAAPADDQYFENHKSQAPLCSTAWTYKETCGRKCQHTGLEASGSGWNTSDKVLLAILSAFAAIMVALIVRKRQKMSNKEALLEQAAMSAAGLQQPHVIGVCILVFLVVAIFVLLGLKNITWALLLIVNTLLFAYLMKLTVESGVSREPMIAPDGTIIRRDSDDSSVEDGSASKESNRPGAGFFTLPTLT